MLAFNQTTPSISIDSSLNDDTKKVMICQRLARCYYNSTRPVFSFFVFKRRRKGIVSIDTFFFRKMRKKVTNPSTRNTLSRLDQTELGVNASLGIAPQCSRGRADQLRTVSTPE